ncbi:MAG: Xaa-Pro peptidase family protein [Planctomycetota bacterium]|nr:Xaa-Pro peptidase family protein [Planctomycetota bacterium]
MHGKRLEKLRDKVAQLGIDVLFLSNPVNVHYMAGMGEDSYLLISADEAVFLTDSRYTEAAQKAVEVAEVKMWKDDLYAHVASNAANMGATVIGFEQDNITVAQHKKLKKACEGADLVATDGLVEELRIIKDESEIELVRCAAEIADKALTETMPYLVEGVTEKEIDAELRYRMNKNGAETVSFAPIVAFDANASLPHAKPGDRELTADSMVQFDWGAQYKHYCSDCSRIFFFGEVDSELEEIYEIVMDANARAKRALKAGSELKDIDGVARSHVTEHGYGENFGHGLGHGVGLLVHEAPRVSPKSTHTARSGMIVTIEAGIYLPGKGGIRVEDEVVVREKGIEILTTLGREPRV